MNKRAFVSLYFDTFKGIKTYGGIDPEDMNDVSFIGNGFSFIDEYMENHKHFFMNITDQKTAIKESIRLNKELKDFDEIYISVSFLRHIKYIYGILDSRCTVGGPAVEYFNSTKISLLTGARFTSSTCEELFKKPYGANYSFYWKDDPHLKNKIVQSVCTISNYCDHQCAFCKYSNDNRYCRNSEKIFQSIVKNNDKKQIMIGSPNTTVATINLLRKYQQQFNDSNTAIRLFIRSDKIVNDALKKFDSLKGFTFKIGLEYFSDKALQLINKGTTIQNALDICETIGKLGGIVVLLVIYEHPYFDKEILEESLENMKKFYYMSMKYNHRIMIPSGTMRMHFINDLELAKSVTSSMYEMRLESFMDDNIVYYADHADKKYKEYNLEFMKKFSEMFNVVIHYDNKYSSIF